MTQTGVCRRGLLDGVCLTAASNMESLNYLDKCRQLSQVRYHNDSDRCV